MSKKNKKNKRKYVIDSRQLFDFEKPKFNGFGCGYGAHGEKKYDRNKQKQRWNKEDEREC